MVENKIFLKTVFKTIKSKFIRYLVNILIVMLAVAIAAALGMLPFSFKDSYVKNFTNYLTPDIVMKCADEKGFQDSDLETLSKVNNVDKTYSFFSMDLENNGRYDRLYFLDLYNNEIANPKLVAGRMPKNYDEIIINKNVDNTSNHKIGDKIIFESYPFDLNTKNKEFTIVGIVDSPLYSTMHPERAMIKDRSVEKYVDSIYYISLNSVPELITNRLPKTDIYVTMKVRSEFMTSQYQEESQKFASDIANAFNVKPGAVTEEQRVMVLTLNENTSYALFYNYNKKINTISIIFPILFIVVCGLVLYLITTRLIQDERPMVACYYSLGASKAMIAMKYLVYTVSSTIIGAIGGYFLGISLVPLVFYRSYNAVYDMNGVPDQFFSPMGMIIGVLLVFVSIGITLISIKIALSEEPATLMQAKAPKPGRKIWLERIGFLWNRFSFSIKSSLRNIFRNKKNLILTTLSVIGSVILVFIGFSLDNAAKAMTDVPMYKNLASNMGTLSTIVVLFGLLMSVLVIYALASMNIDERVREIAVLKVLGYHDNESALYACRELFFITVFAALIGIPIALGVTSMIFDTLEFAKISAVKWYSYILSYVIVVSSSIISSFMLYPKIKKIDFNISLKSVE